MASGPIAAAWRLRGPAAPAHRARGEQAPAAQQLAPMGPAVRGAMSVAGQHLKLHAGSAAGAHEVVVAPVAVMLVAGLVLPVVFVVFGAQVLVIRCRDLVVLLVQACFPVVAAWGMARVQM